MSVTQVGVWAPLRAAGIVSRLTAPTKKHKADECKHQTHSQGHSKTSLLIKSENFYHNLLYFKVHLIFLVCIIDLHPSLLVAREGKGI